MKHLTILLLFSTIMIDGFTQKEIFDITTYTAPKGWKKQISEGNSGVQYSVQDDAKGTFCLMTLFKAIPGTDNSKTNFEASWDELVKGIFSVSTPPEMQPVAEEDGWEVQSGYAPFESSGLTGVALLTSISGYGKIVNILILTNTDVYEQAMTLFLESVSFKKPATKPTDATGNTNTKPVQSNNTSIKDKYTFNTTNFDDGWTSVIKEDWVEVTKGDMTVFLLYGLPYNVSNFSGTGVRERDYYWDNYVTKYFSVESKRYNDNGEVIGSFQPDYVEGWAKDKATGQRRFIGMRLSIAPNTAFVVIASAKNESLLRQQFPKANDKYTSDLANMSSYNKFAVGKNDLTGTWSSSGGGTMNWYSTTTGNNVGATGVVASDIFRFNTDGSYSSDHSGASGWVGSMNTYQSKYRGTYSVSNWNVTATKRFNGKTESFSAWFEIGKEGRLLHLETPGLKYSLFKEN
ncbi:MAG TPA: hypothetical protein PLU37_05550 [Chitinophagaceae bacterium]|nr:hypothetical protein [Chitinophagaceae bacterium]